MEKAKLVPDTLEAEIHYELPEPVVASMVVPMLGQDNTLPVLCSGSSGGTSEAGISPVTGQRSIASSGMAVSHGVLFLITRSSPWPIPLSPGATC